MTTDPIRARLRRRYFRSPALLVAAAMSMAGCSRSEKTAAAPPPPVELKAGAAEPGDEVILHVSGLAAPAHEKAGLYLFGKLSVPSHPLRALLLRSTDGGARWTEVLPEVEHSEVLFVEFEGCQGRALVGWSTEGPGELKLLASSDCGATAMGSIRRFEISRTSPRAAASATVLTSTNPVVRCTRRSRGVISIPRG